MLLKDLLTQNAGRISKEWVPAAIRAVEQGRTRLEERLDALNCSLAAMATPVSRRSRVTELTLQEKATVAGQQGVALKAVEGTGADVSRGQDGPRTA